MFEVWVRTADAALEMIEEGYAMLTTESFDTQSHPELLAVQSRLEAVSRKQPAITHKLIARLTAQTSPIELGGKSWTDVLSNRLRIGRGEARRRLDEADELGPRTAMTGEPLPPLLSTVAAAQAAGAIGAEHVRIIRRFFADLSAAVDIETRQACEAELARIAAEYTPDALRKAADRLLALVHPDGDFSDVDRARRRLLIIGKREADGMSKISGLWIPRPAPRWMRCSPSGPHRAYATPMTKFPVWTANPVRRTFKMICAPRHSATMMC